MESKSTGRHEKETTETAPIAATNSVNTLRTRSPSTQTPLRRSGQDSASLIEGQTQSDIGHCIGWMPADANGAPATVEDDDSTALQGHQAEGSHAFDSDAVDDAPAVRAVDNDSIGTRSPSSSGSLKRKRSPISSGLSPARSVPSPRLESVAHGKQTKSSTSHDQQRSSDKSRSTSPLTELSQTPWLSQTPVIDAPEPPSTLDSTTEARAIYVADSQDDEDLSSDSALEEDPQAPKHQSSQPRPRLDTYDSDSSLEDLDVLLGCKKSTEKKDSSTPLTAFRSGKMGSSAKTSKSTLVPDFSAAFERLVRQSKREEDAKVKIEAVRNQLKAPEEEEKEESDADKDLDEESLKALLKEEDDPEKAERLQKAIERTEVLEKDPVWHFFDCDKEVKPRPVSSWPASEHDNMTWLSQMKDAHTREHAFTSGFACERLSTSGLPPEMSSWLWDAAIWEQREQLAQSYLNTLVACPNTINDGLRPDMLQATLEDMGARLTSVVPTDDIKPSSHRVKGTPRPPAQLSRVLRLSCGLAPSMSNETLIYAINMVLRMSIDRIITETLDISLQLSATITSLVGALRKEDANPALHSIARTFLSTLKSPVLQARLITVLPKQTPRLHFSARRLALSFLLNSEAYLTYPLKSTASLTNITTIHLTASPITTSTDFRAFAASIRLLDVAIDGGFGPPPLDAPKDVIDAFNAHVDALHATLSRLNSRIVDTGASHMLRTEAKTALSMLLLRLDYGVRTKPRPRRNVFVETLEKRAVVGKVGKKGVGGMWGVDVSDGRRAEKDMMRLFLEGKKRREEKRGVVDGGAADERKAAVHIGD